MAKMMRDVAHQVHVPGATMPLKMPPAALMYLDERRELLGEHGDARVMVVKHKKMVSILLEIVAVLVPLAEGGIQ